MDTRLATLAVAFTASIFSLGGCVVSPPSSSEFDQSIKAHHAVGSDENTLVHDFTLQGYKYQVNDKGDKSLRRDTASGPLFLNGCDYEQFIYWHADPSGKIRDISASSRTQCL